MKIIIIGSGAAGISAVQTIRQNDPDKELNITLISSERETTYSPCALPYVISANIPYKRLARLDKKFFKENKVQAFWGGSVCKISPAKKCVTLKNGKTFFYDKLLIATGSVPVKPPIQGIDKKGVFCVDTLSNTRRIKNYLRYEKIISSKGKTNGKIAIIGAGFTGIETALALRKQGIEVVILEMLDRILARMLDADFINLVHQKISSLPTDNGEKTIEFKLSTEVVEIKGKDKVKSVVLKNGDNIPVNMVIVAVGVKPNMWFLNESEIKTNKGIVVDTRMQTSVPDIYAAGDVAETFDYITGEKTISAIWPNAVEQGKIAALNIIGKETHYQGAYNINVLNLEGTPVVSMGEIFDGYPPPTGGGITEKFTATHSDEPRPSGLDDIVLRGSYTYQNENSNRRLFLMKNNKAQIDDFRMVGFESIGEFRNLGFIWSSIQKKTSILALDSNILKDNTVPFNTQKVANNS
ncbi:MAG: FAD-dependent oxidoreductase [Planctomycetota bacterium]